MVRIRVKCRVKIFKKGFTVYKVSQFFFLQTEGLYIHLNILSGTKHFRETFYFLGTYFAFKLLKLVVSLRNIFFQISIVSKHFTASFSFIGFHIFSDVDVQVTTATKWVWHKPGGLNSRDQLRSRMSKVSRLTFENRWDYPSFWDQLFFISVEIFKI